MKVSVKQGKLEKFPCNLLVVNLFQGVKKTGTGTGAVNRALGGLIDQMIQDEHFEGKEGETIVVPVFKGKIKARKVLLLGLGEQSKFNAEVVRKVSAAAVKKARQIQAAKVGTILHGAGVGGLEPAIAAQALTEGSLLGGYSYNKYKSAEAQKEAQFPREVMIVDHGDRLKIRAIAAGIREGEIYAQATIFARDLVNEPSSNMVPKDLADAARTIAKSASGMEVKILNRNQCEKLGMGAYLGVAKGSDHEPYFLHLVWRPNGGNHKSQITNHKIRKIAIVGKGITFDSGGMSLKPAAAMETMKMDMSGCAAMLGVFHALTKLQPNVEVHGISAVCENMPSGRAQKPGDIVRTMLGKTIEVLNTDAEGRLTLADALTYAARLKPDAIIDLATLTGACIAALGEEVAACLGNDQALLERVKKAAAQAGERVWELPLVPEYKEVIKSHVADYCNITPGKKGAGTITAGLLLAEFVGKTPWVHLDIAGPAWAEKEVIPYIPRGGTGFGVRTVLEFLKHY